MPHLPVSASSRFSGRSRAGIYGDVIEELDWSAGEIVRTLKEQGIDRDTLVIFTSDNGPWHDLPARMLQKAVEPWHTGSKGLLRGAKGSSYEGGFRVPAIVRWPGAIPEGRVNGDIVSSLDLFPTMAKLAGADLPSGRMYDGSDLMPLLSGTMSKSPRETFYYFVGKSLEAVRRGPWKLRAAPNPELYNLDLDPSEMYNVYDRYQDVGDRLLRELKAGLT
jgi:arylsulfatase A-like enzyme